MFSPKLCFQIIIAAKWLVWHSSMSPNQQRRPLPSLLSLSFFYAVTPPICKVTCQYLALYRMQSGPYLECVMSCAEKKGLCIGMRGIGLYNLFVNAQMQFNCPSRLFIVTRALLTIKGNRVTRTVRLLGKEFFQRYNYCTVLQ